MKLIPSALLSSSLTALISVSAASAESNYIPSTYGVSTGPVSDGLKKYGSGTSVKLDGSSSVLTLDYGSLVGGFPYVEIESVDGTAQIELKYSEPYNGLNRAYSDGPWMYTSGLMNSFRSETFNITKAGKTESFFLQGGLRWQTITLVSGSSVTIRQAGLKPSVSILNPQSLPGSFSTSDSMYQDVWDLGARAVQGACVDAGSQPSTWEVTPDGVLIRGQFPAVSARGNSFSDYTLEFSTKISASGTGWRVAGGANGGYGAYFTLTSNRPSLKSKDYDSLPINSLIAGYGFTIINQAILPSAPPRVFDVNITIEEDKWYKISTVISDDAYTISVDDHIIAVVSNAEYQSYVNTGWGSPSLTQGTFGFGPYPSQSAYFKDVIVKAKNGSEIYYNDMMADNVAEEYAVASNSAAYCLDGAKRDREIWIGDFVHTARIISVSSGRYDFISSMIDFEFDWQLPADSPGHDLVPIQAMMGARKEYREAFYPSEFGETDYQFFFLMVLGNYFAVTGDEDRLRKQWSGTKRLVQTLVDRYLDPHSNLMASSDASWFTAQGVQNATAPSALFVASLNPLINIAHILGDRETETSWRSLASKIGGAINSQLWNNDLGAYSYTLSNRGDSAILATAFAIHAGIASSNQASRSIKRLDDVFLKIGYKDSTTAGNDASTQLSPNTQGFLFESLFLAHLQYNVAAETVLPAIRNLSEVFWPKMVNQNEYYTGASWEYLYQDGSPGIGIFTSLSHPWGGAATYIFSNYILGIRTEWNKAASRYQWVFDPAWEIIEGLGLKWAKGRVPLPNGGHIEVEWVTRSTGKKGSSKPQVTVKVIGDNTLHVDMKGN